MTITIFFMLTALAILGFIFDDNDEDGAAH